MNRKLQPGTVTALLVVVLLTSPSMAQDQPTKVAVNWDKVIRVSQTNPNPASRCQSSPATRNAGSP